VKFSEILYIFKVISKTNNQIFASICIFREYFCCGFHTFNRNNAYGIPLDSKEIAKLIHFKYFSKFWMN
jgi:hypothetical protein